MSGVPTWDRLTSLATLGTARAPDSLDDLWPDRSVAVAGSAEQSLLRAAAATYLWEHAGKRTAAAESAAAPPALALDGRPQIREAAAWRLGRLLSGEHAALLEEWLALAAAAQRVLPPHWIPVVLDHVQPDLCLRFASVLGPAALWLAQHNPAWTERVQPPEPSLDRWSAGTLAERCLQLRLIRAKDPAEGMAWLQATWPTDPPDAREAFLKVLMPTVSLEDEAFLASVLDDKRKAVRLAAAQCLVGLPGSAYAARAIARADSLLRWESAGKGLAKLLRKARLEVQLPTAVDKEAQRDGIELKPPAHRKIGERAFWMTQMLTAVPPAHWTQRFECSAAALLEAAGATEYAQDLLSTWSMAAVRHPTGEWLDALCAAWLASGLDLELQRDALVRLLAAAGDQQPALMLKYLRAWLPAQFGLALSVLTSLPLQWTAAMTQLVLEALREVVRQDTQKWSHSRNTLEPWARRCDVPTARQQVTKLMEVCGEASAWRNALEQFQDVVEFRAAMQQELEQ